MSGDGYELPKTIAERNEGLTDFWDKGYLFGLKMAVSQIEAEMRWQVELQMRGNPHASVLLERLEVVANILRDNASHYEDFREVSVSVGGELGEA